MEKLGFYYNMNTCMACGACQVACKNAHGLMAGEFFRRTEMLAEGPFSGSCNHCEEAACVKVCPTKAMYKAEDGTTLHDDGRCIGCGSCMWNCPYGAISFSKSKGVTQKCDACAQRRKAGLEPVCVSACPTLSLKFAPIKERNADMPFLPDSDITLPCLNIKPADKIIVCDALSGQKGGMSCE